MNEEHTKVMVKEDVKEETKEEIKDIKDEIKDIFLNQEMKEMTVGEVMEEETGDVEIATTEDTKENAKETNEEEWEEVKEKEEEVKEKEEEVKEEVVKEKEEETKEEEKREKKSKRVSFDSVHVREYQRKYDGGGGVPDSGGFPLGLDWTFAETEKIPIDNFEQARNGARHEGALGPAQKLISKKRKEMLDDLPDSKQITADTNSLKIFKRRTGCGCGYKKKKKCTVDNGCECVKNGISCHVHGCACTERECGNPKLCIEFM